MKWLILFISFSVSADVCKIRWIPASERVDGTPLTREEIASYNIYINGKKEFTAKGGNNTDYPYYVAGTCPTCTEIAITTLDTGGRESERAVPVCPPAQPVICQ